MAYNLYQWQMAQAWVERVNKEQAIAEKFWVNRHNEGGVAGALHGYTPSENESVANSGKTGKTGTTTLLKNRLTALENELAVERKCRQQVQSELATLQTQNSAR